MNAVTINPSRRGDGRQLVGGLVAGAKDTINAGNPG
jgi:hypothetical protein